GTLQILLTAALGPALAPALGLSFREGVFLGAMLALSSTAAAIRVLVDRGELESVHGRIVVGLLAAQDLAMVPMVVALPNLGYGGLEILAVTAQDVVKAAAVLVLTYVAGTRVVPWVTRRVVQAHSRELLLLSAV